MTINSKFQLQFILIFEIDIFALLGVIVHIEENLREDANTTVITVTSLTLIDSGVVLNIVVVWLACAVTATVFLKIIILFDVSLNQDKEIFVTQAIFQDSTTSRSQFELINELDSITFWLSRWIFHIFKNFHHSDRDIIDVMFHHTHTKLVEIDILYHI